MSYINYLNKQQRTIERGANGQEIDEDDDNQSSDDSNLSEDNAAGGKAKGKVDKKDEQMTLSQIKAAQIAAAINA